MAPRKKNQTKPEQPGQELEQNASQAEQAEGQEQTEDTTATQEAQEQGQEAQQDTAERDEFADIPNPCVYCGPSVRGVARQYTTYQGGIPKELKDFIKAHPAARALITHTGQFAGMRKRLETPGTAEAIAYKRVKYELQ